MSLSLTLGRPLTPSLSILLYKLRCYGLEEQIFFFKKKKAGAFFFKKKKRLYSEHFCLEDSRALEQVVQGCSVISHTCSQVLGKA